MGSIASFNKRKKSPNKEINQIYPETSLVNEPLINQEKIGSEKLIKPIIKKRNSPKKSLQHYQTTHFEPITEEEEEKFLDDSKKEVYFLNFCIFTSMNFFFLICCIILSFLSLNY